jgi:hypothetical protein
MLTGVRASPDAAVDDVAGFEVGAPDDEGLLRAKRPGPGRRASASTDSYTSGAMPRATRPDASRRCSSRTTSGTSPRALAHQLTPPSAKARQIGTFCAVFKTGEAA